MSMANFQMTKFIVRCVKRPAIIHVRLLRCASRLGLLLLLSVMAMSLTRRRTDDPDCRQCPAVRGKLTTSPRLNEIRVRFSEAMVPIGRIPDRVDGAVLHHPPGGRRDIPVGRVRRFSCSRRIRKVRCRARPVTT